MNKEEEIKEDKEPEKDQEQRQEIELEKESEKVDNKEKENDKMNNINNINNEEQKAKEESNKQIKEEDLKTKIMNSKKEFLLKINNIITDISSNYDKLISSLNNNQDNEEISDILKNIENLQNNIFEDNEVLNQYLKKNDINKEKKLKEKNEKILKINCNIDINEIKKKILKNKYEKIIIKELSSDSFNEIFASKETYKNDIIIKKCDIENYNINFDEVNKLKLKKCKIPYFSNFLFINKINELYLEHLNLINETLDIILNSIKLNKDLISNIKIFSIKSNNISIINLNSDNNEIKFNNLKFLNLSNNKISKINHNIFDVLPTIKIIDLTYNNINIISRYKNFLNISKEKNCILFLAKNRGIYSEKNREEYINYLKNILPEKFDDNYCIKIFNLEGLFLGRTYKLLSEIKFPEINNLNSLNLSYNNLNDKDLIDLIGKNKEFFRQIKKLILCSNYLTEEFINLLIKNENDEEYSKIFLNLRKLDLSGNPIKFKDLNLFKNFINSFNNIKTLIFKYTPFEKDFNNFLKIKAEVKLENTDDTKNEDLSEIYTQLEEIIEKEKFISNKKINIKMMNTNDYKYLSIISKYFPYLLSNIKLESKFSEDDRI